MQIGGRSSKPPSPSNTLASARPTLNALLFIYLLVVPPPIKMVSSGGVDYCYSDIGCFPLNNEFYHPKHRPINVRPWHRRRIRTQFELFNREHPEGYMLVPWNRFNLRQSGFNPRLETKVIIPGWLDNINRALWVKKLKDALLWLWTPANIIVVRWTNFTPYTIATANTRVVGAELANLIKSINYELNYHPAYYHIIGHSLGAHIAGYCGDRVHKLGRITALDPARPFFQHMPKSVRLDRGDAKFVDAIHSDFTPENAIWLLMSFGMTTPVGHVDFYPNGPPLLQPGCLRDTLLSVQTGIAKGLAHNSLSVAFLESVRYLTACDHQRSHEWFIESITNRECLFVGVRCNEFEGLINGRCTCDDSPSACAIMGIHADQMYLSNVHEELWPIRAGSSINAVHKPVWPPPLPSHIRQHHHKGAAIRPHTLPMPNAVLNVHGHHHKMAAPLDMDYLANDYNLREQLALSHLHHTLPLPQQPTKDEIYAQLKHEAQQLHSLGEPSIVGLANGGEQLAAAGSELMDPTSGYGDGLFELPHAALDDMAFLSYLTANLLINRLDSGAGALAERRHDTNETRDGSGDRGIGGGVESKVSKRDLYHTTKNLGHPDQYAGHPALLSSLNRDIENWYENNARWHLRTNNRPNYCSNQYQLLLYLGPLKTRKGRDRLRANLLVSIIGTRGQLLNQRFVPRGSTLTSFTMQPFFILLEGSYSLGQIKTVAVAWEARKDPDPVQVTVTFQSSLVQQIGQNLPAYKAKQYSWLPEMPTKHDKTSAFSRHPQPSPPPTRHPYATRRHVRPLLSEVIKIKTSGGHYTSKYQDLNRRLSGPSGRDAGSEDHQSNGTKVNRPTESASDGCSSRACSSGEQTGERHVSGIERRGTLLSRSKRDAQSPSYPVDNEQELNYQQQLEDLLRLKQQNQDKQQLLKLQNHAQHVIGGSEQPDDEEPDLVPQSSDSSFGPLVDPPDAVLPGPKPYGALPLESIVDPEEGELVLDLHNIDLHPDITAEEDSIVINQVVVSPLQAHYGGHGRSAKIFCPLTGKQRLVRDRTLQLRPTLMSKCYHNHHLHRNPDIINKQPRPQLAIY